MSRAFLYSLIFIAAALLVSVFVFWWQIRTSLNPAGGKIIFKIEKGQSAKTIADNLIKAKLIKNPFVFRLYVFFAASQYALKSGEYEFSPAMSVREIADSIILGGTDEIWVTIPEGFTLKQVEERLIAAGLLKSGELAEYHPIDPPSILSDKPKSASLEGYLFPDTYRFFKDAGLSDIVGKMISNFDNKITPDLKLAIKNSSHSVFETVVMASLIEKEVKSDTDREIVSGILWKRLNAKIPLQVDATLIYITGRKEVSEADKKINSPYNTYYYRGLPKGPIASPGLTAIKAAIFPETSPYWFYLSTKDGVTIFSQTIEEHNRNRAIYLK